jgi:hypothetical protein
MKHLVLLAIAIVSATAYAADWPREINTQQGMITIYEPQISSFDGNSMSARAAISITPAGADSLIFGAVWLDCRVLTDRPTRTVKILELKVKQIRFPNMPEDETAAITASLETEIPRWDMTFSLDELLESLDTAQKEKENAHDIDVAPPKIIVMQHPAVLVLIDGDPVLTDVEGTDMRRVANTPYFIVQDVPSGKFYLRGGDIWYESREITGPWGVTRGVPPEVVTLSQQSTSDDPADQGGPQSTPAPSTGKIPEIVVSTVPAELIATDGPVQLSPIAGTELLYASNTSSKLFLEIGNQDYYILISGRWYMSRALTGPWTYVASDKLPPDFAKIPPGADRDAVLASVAGTVPAKEAILDSQIPQTAEVDRIDATADVQYDGDPQFDPIENTTMQYAVNTATPVIYTDGRYFACDRGVWFEGAGPRGPWGVSVAIPPVIYTIPPRCPVYYVRYVRVYGYTPTVAYVGYTAGYTGCYVYNHTVVYGTGYAYRPWHRHYYYARPMTWGFGVHYEPWTGWSMGYATGWWRPRGWFAYENRGGAPREGWWGPTGYRPAYHPVRGPVYREGYHPVYRPLPASREPIRGNAGAVRTAGPNRSSTLYEHWTSGVRRPTTGTMPRSAAEMTRPTPPVRGEVRNWAPPATPRPVLPPRMVTPPRANDQPRVPEGGIRPVPQPPEVHVAPPDMPRVPRPVARENNVYATPEGNIVRQTPQGWQQREQGSWKPAVQPPPQTGVNIDAQVRQRAAERSSSFRTPAPPPPPPQQRPAPQVRQPERQPAPDREKGRK